MFLVDTMCQDKWVPVMTAAPMERKIAVFAKPVKNRTEDGEIIENTICSLTRENYLLNHTMPDRLKISGIIH
jgi:hypothetical protein